MRTSEQPKADAPPATSWVRTALQQCAVLETARSLAPGTKPLLVFAIRWAPFGGATAEEVFITFGVTRRKFLQMTVDALNSRPFDDPGTGRLKQHLSLILTRAWRADPTGAPWENSELPR